MATAIKEITIERGKDVRDFSLFVFGGGGPLHGVDLARELRIPKVVIPPEPGNFSALGMLFAEARVDDAQSFIMSVQGLTAAELRSGTAEMKERVRQTLVTDFSAPDVTYEFQAEMRFVGQKHSLRVQFDDQDDGSALRERFFEAYLSRYGHVDRSAPVEIIGMRVTGSAKTERPELAQIQVTKATETPHPREVRAVHYASEGRLDTPVYVRSELPVGFAIGGPAIIEEFGSTTVIGPKDSIAIGAFGQMTVTLGEWGVGK
ncbi:MAG: hypothetical protein KDK08_29700, partial [Rhizobiaceae bacterium]|nr:hypothetical protein [Rhizobiaceae bacterium]